MYEDEPQDKVHDVLAGAIFGEHPLGRPIIGRADVVSSVPVPDIAAWHDAPLRAGQHRGGRGRQRGPRRGSSRWWTAPSAAPPRQRARASRLAERRRAARCASTARTPSSTTSASARPGIPRGDDRRFALRVLDTILGGSTSSRLFQEVREKRGLAYSVYSYSSQYADSGQVALYVGTRPDNVAEALDVIGRSCGGCSRTA